MHILSFYIPQSVIGWLIVGLIAGWLAGKVSRGRGFGCIANIFLGLVGAILGGWIFTQARHFRRRIHLQHCRGNARRRHPGGDRAPVFRRRRVIESRAFLMSRSPHVIR